jgi:ABC-type amino acid transport substrate-binding protein
MGAASIARAWFLPRTDATWDRIRSTRVLRVGMDATYPPFESVNQTGQVEGYDVDLALELARRWGVGCEFVNVHLDGLYDALRADKCDVLLSALPYDATMTRDVAYSPSYFNAGLLLVVRADERSIQGVNDLDNRTVGVEVGAAAHLEARRLVEQARIPLRVAPYATANEALQALRSGSVDAAIVDSVTAYGFAREPGGVRPLKKYLTDDQYVMALHPASGYLWKRIADELARMKQDGFLDALQERWFVGATSS